MDLTKRENEQTVQPSAINLEKPVEQAQPVVNLEKPAEAAQQIGGINLGKKAETVVQDGNTQNQGLEGLGQSVDSANINLNYTQPMNEGPVDANQFQQEQPKEPSIIDEYGQKINNYIDNNETFKKVEKAATDIGEQLSQELNKAVDGLSAGVAGVFGEHQVNNDPNGQNFQSQGNNEQYQGNFQQSVNLNKDNQAGMGANFEKFKDNSHNKFEAKYNEMNRNGKVVTPDKLSVDPVVAVILSFFLCGLGQMVNGQLNKGLLLLAINVVQATLLSCCCGLGIITGFIGSVLIMIDAYKCADALKHGESLGEYEIRLN